MIQKIRRGQLFLLIGCFVLSSGQATAQFWNLGGGNTVSALSADGSVAAGTGSGQYFYWTPSGGRVLVGGTAPGSGVGGQAEMSHDGTRFSGTVLNPATGIHEFGYHEIGTGWTLLGGVGAPCSNEVSSGWGISGNGQSVVGLGWLTCSPAHAIQWKQGGTTSDLGSTVAGRSSRANHTNFDGSVVVGWQDATIRQGAVWNNGVQTLLTHPGGELSEVSDVSDNGRWLVGSGNSSNGSNAWRWDNTVGTSAGYQDLGRPAGTNASWRGASSSVSGDGQKIVGFYRPFPGPATFGRGFIWDNGTIVDLNTYVAGFGIDTGGVTLALPLDISADGTTIAGIGSGGVGFVVRVPEPSGLGGVLLCVAVLAQARRRR